MNEIVTAVLQCLFVVVEDNPFAMQKIKSNSETQLERLLCLEGTAEGSDPSILLVKTLAAGVIINTCGGNIATLPVNVINEIITILASTLAIDHRLACSQLSSNIPLVNEAGKVPEVRGKEAEVLEKQLKSVTQMLDAQQSAIEIIANICSCEGKLRFSTFLIEVHCADLVCKSIKHTHTQLQLKYILFYPLSLTSLCTFKFTVIAHYFSH